MRTAFTLIELLAVVAIITLLVALLMPALDQAIYQAELATCSAGIRSIATGAVVYAAASRRSYPYRPMVDGEIWNCTMLFINTGRVGPVTTGRVLDDRPLLKTIFPLNKTFNCPLAPSEADLESEQSQIRVFASYASWFGVRYPTNRADVRIVPRQAMKKLGDRLAWSFEGNDYSFNLLAGDMDLLTVQNYANPLAQSGHQDKSQKMQADVQENDTNTYSAWTVRGDPRRGALDTNFATDDLAVSRSLNVTYDDNRMSKIPLPLNAYPDIYLQVPRP